jgi:hypothetical protein
MNVPNETREQSVALYFDRTLLPSGATFFLAATHLPQHLPQPSDAHLQMLNLLQLLL